VISSDRYGGTMSYDDCLDDKRENYQNCSVHVVYDSCAQ